jgi:MAF protein
MVWLSAQTGSHVTAAPFYREIKEQAYRKELRRMRKIILASGSPRRKELLEQIGIRFEIHKAEGEEIITSSVPEEAVKELALQKAQEVAGKCDGDIIIGADTVVAVDGQILGNPADRADAMRMLRLLPGKEHQVITGVAVLSKEKGKAVNFGEVTKVHVFPMTEEQMERYIETGEPMDKAGAYGIQGKFAVYVSGIEGDYNNVVGLPAGRLYQEALAAGIDLLL